MKTSLLMAVCGATALLAGCAQPMMKAAAPESIDVYFPYSSARLTPAAQAQAAATAQAYKTRNLSKVAVIGHTDTSGGAKANMALSDKRAKAVATAINQNGVPASAIVTDSKGEADLAVQTGNGVKKADNRRVTVLMYP